MLNFYKKEQNLLVHFNIPVDNYSLTKLIIGHINHTYKVSGQRCFILQKINTAIFKNPEGLMKNIEVIGKHLKRSDYPYEVLNIIKTKSDQLFFRDTNGACWRVFDFIKDSYSIDQVEYKEQAYQGGQVFGTLLSCLADLDVSKIVETIPNFHNWRLRWKAFEVAIENDLAQKSASISDFIQQVKSYEQWLKITLKTIAADQLPIRITHNDTKINNILFDQKTRMVKAVIDWDTIMPSTLISDYGDMVRTFANSSNEEEKDISKVNFNFEKFTRLTDGFLSKIKRNITQQEQKNLVNGALIITYIQTIRFLTDYLNGNTYYQTNYATQNLVRAKNQMHFFEQLFNNKLTMEKYIKPKTL